MSDIEKVPQQTTENSKPELVGAGFNKISVREFSFDRIKKAVSHHYARISKTYNEHKLAYLFILPAFLAMTILHFLPLLQGIYMSLLRLNQFTISRYLAAPFVGLSNYYNALFNPSSPVRLGLWSAARNTFFYGIIVTIATMVLGMVVALMINRNFKGRSIVRALFLFPWIIPQFVVGLLWGFMWQKSTGIINIVLYDWLHIYDWLGFLGIHFSPEKPFWLMGDPKTLAAIFIIIAPMAG